MIAERDVKTRERRPLDLCSGAASFNTAPVCKRRVAAADWFPAVDVYDAGHEYLFEFDPLCLRGEQVQFSLDRDALLLVGTQMRPQPDGTSLPWRSPVGAHIRRFALPADSCIDEIYGTLEEGVLILHVPKHAAPREETPPLSIQFDETDHEPTQH